jgi:hypothetical protein
MGRSTHLLTSALRDDGPGYIEPNIETTRWMTQWDILNGDGHMAILIQAMPCEYNEYSRAVLSRCFRSCQDRLELRPFL